MGVPGTIPIGIIHSCATRRTPRTSRTGGGRVDAPTADDIAQAIAAYLPLEASRASFAEWLTAAWGDYTDTAIDITVGEVLSAGLRDWRGDELE